jgi:hypothetical protein
MGQAGTMFKGVLDEMRVFARALPPEQVKILARREPIGHWTFDDGSGGSAKDSSGSCNGGVVSGGTFSPTGRIAGSLSLDGATSAVEVSDRPELDTARAFTVAAWVAPTQQADMVVAMKGLGPTSDMLELSLSAGPVARPIARIQMAGGSVFTATGTSTYPTNGTWMHLAVTYDGQTLKLYRDRTSIVSVSAPFLRVDNGVPLVFGAKADGTRRFKGGVDDVRVYRRALSLNEIAALP